MDESNIYNLIKSGYDFYLLPADYQKIVAKYCHRKYLSLRGARFVKNTIITDDFYKVFDIAYSILKQKIINGAFILKGKSSIKHYLWLIIIGVEKNEARKRKKLNEAFRSGEFKGTDPQQALRIKKMIDFLWTVINKHSSKECIQLLKTFFPELNQNKPSHKDYIKNLYPNLEESKKKQLLANLRKKIQRCKESLRKAVISQQEYIDYFED